jgi:hypothetical protein
MSWPHHAPRHGCGELGAGALVEQQAGAQAPGGESLGPGVSAHKLMVVCLTVLGRLAGHHLPGHRPHQYLLPKVQPLRHRPLQCRDGHPQPAAQALLLLPGLPHAP